MRARQERERERKHSHSPSWEDSPPRRATLRRSCLPLWKEFLSKTLIFWRRKQVTPPSFECSARPNGRNLTKKKGKKEHFRLSLLCVRTKTEQHVKVDRFVQISRYPIHSFIHSGAWLSAIYIYTEIWTEANRARERFVFPCRARTHFYKKKDEEEKRDLRSESLKI